MQQIGNRSLVNPSESPPRNLIYTMLFFFVSLSLSLLDKTTYVTLPLRLFLNLTRLTNT